MSAAMNPVSPEEVLQAVRRQAAADKWHKLDNYTFCLQWRELPDADRSQLPADVRTACIERYRSLTPFISASIRQAERKSSAPGNGGDHRGERGESGENPHQSTNARG